MSVSVVHKSQKFKIRTFSWLYYETAPIGLHIHFQIYQSKCMEFPRALKQRNINMKTIAAASHPTLKEATAMSLN
jgi:hypothetical protein